MSLLINELLLKSDDKKLLDIGSLPLPDSGMVLLCGPSGAGKSLFLKCLIGLIKVQNNQSRISISMGDKRIDPQNQHAFSYGYIPQDLRNSYDQNKTIGYHIKEALLDRPMASDDLNLLFTAFDLPISILKNYPHQCSGGQLQRILAILADLHKPVYLFADEAISALDDVNENIILQYLKNKSANENCLIIIVSHKYDLSFYDHVIYLTEGKVSISKPINNLSVAEKSTFLPMVKSDKKNKSNTLGKEILMLKDGKLPYQLQGNKRLNLSFRYAKSYGIHGKSGAGKTTLLRCLSGLLALETGTLQWHKNKGNGLLTQLVFQHPSTAINPTHNISNYFNEYSSESPSDYKSSLSDLMLAMGLSEEILSKYPSQLSGGELQRITIIRALACNPLMILFDEAFASIDQATSETIYSVLLDFQQKNGTTYIFVTHDIDFLATICDDIIEL